MWYTHGHVMSCTHERGTSHTWMSHVAYMNESCHIHEWVMSHIHARVIVTYTWKCNVTFFLFFFLSRMYGWVMSHMHEWVMSCTHRRQEKQRKTVGVWRQFRLTARKLRKVSLRWRIYTCDRTHSYVWHDSIMCVTWLIHTCDMTHPYMWHDSSICVSAMPPTCPQTPRGISVSQDLNLRVQCLTHKCVMTHS